MKVYKVIAHLELEDEEAHPAGWDWHDLLDLGPNESVSVHAELVEETS